MKCFYHSHDLDGWCSGAIVKMKYPECELIGLDYGDPFPWDRLEENEIVYMVDFSIQPYSEMHELATWHPLVWIDHHKTAIENFEQWRLPAAWATCYLESDMAACEITWRALIGEGVPDAVKLLSQYDIWDHLDPRCLPFQYGMRAIASLPDDIEFWEKIFLGDAIDHIRANGEIILAYEEKTSADFVMAWSFPLEFCDMNFIAVNRMGASSKLFETVWDAEKYHGMLTFGWANGKWHIRMYSLRDDVDLSPIAKVHGGGGHASACGFECDELPFNL